MKPRKRKHVAPDVLIWVYWVGRQSVDLNLALKEQSIVMARRDADRISAYEQAKARMITRHGLEGYLQARREAIASMTEADL